MGTELVGPFFGVLLLVLALLAASYSSVAFSKRHDAFASSIFGLCVGVFVLLPAFYWGLFF